MAAAAARKSVIEKMKQNLNAGGPHVGDIVWWSLACNRTGDTQVAASRFEALWKDAGLDEDLLSRPPTPARSLKDAGVATLANQDGWLFRFAAETADRTIYAIVREEPRGDGTIVYHQEAQVWVDIAGDFGSDIPGHRFVGAVRAKYEALVGNYTSREIRASILRTLDRACAISIREAGGVYWVPAPYAATGSSLKTAIEQVGGSVFSLLPVHETKVGNEALGNAARGALEAEIADLKDEIQKFQADAPSAGTLERRLATFTGLQSRAQLYRDLLSVEVSDLETKLSELTASVTKILGGLATEEA